MPPKTPSSRKKATPAKGKAKAPAGTEGSRAKRSAHHRGGLTESAEDYLECISNLLIRHGYVSASDVADALGLIRPSVSLMIKRLADQGYLERQPYRGFVLTPKGQKVASSIRERHAVLTDIFQQLGLDPEAFQADIEGLEHHISDAAFLRFKQLVAHLQQHPLP
ncbi:iron (metal) dependent repressor, DtxR family [Verrucomicrobium sp. GAS474]|uniref:metal-dependent transcriptional regulator n=1 Tax=Verrucomicrobium sp. GAS474 TaxID=1882831 RepID=UPI00087A265F|nr:iron dependent repressor, metal binding and dimerization domain protein [Verrucomicrobium sp. GAS474]SDU06137.1 iron (metal) dependent repressor, DtxR family [Verrucomicrobium sp. GAS474]